MIRTLLHAGCVFVLPVNEAKTLLEAVEAHKTAVMKVPSWCSG